MATLSTAFAVARNKNILVGIITLLVTLLFLDYMIIKTSAPAGTQDLWSIQSEYLGKALENYHRSYAERLPKHPMRKNRTETRRARILCWILTGPQFHDARAIHVKRTWGARCNKLIFISTKTDVELGAIAIPGVIEGRDWLWAKTKAALKLIWEEHGNDYDWFLKADDNTYVIMENLRYFLKDYDTSKPYYFGCRVQYGEIKASVNYGGAGYVLSREALRMFVELALPDADKCKQGHDGDEDTELGVCLDNVGITPGDTRDKEGKHRFLHSNPESHFGWAQHNHWPAVRDYYGPGLNCCSPEIVSFHNVRPEGLYALEFLIYHFYLHDSDEAVST